MLTPEQPPLTPEQRAICAALLAGEADGATLETLPLLELEVLAGALRAAHTMVREVHEARRQRLVAGRKKVRHG
jgi:hypothetical protein